MKVTHIKAENIKRLRAVDLAFDPAQGLFVISGKNANGKTSLLDSIMYALGGKKLVPGEPIRRGADGAKVEVVLGEDGQPKFTVRRVFVAGRESHLSIETPEGMSPKSPQALLESFLGTLTFDPMAFVRMDPKEQAETLRKLAGLDLSDLDARRAEAFETRTEAGRTVRQLEGALAELPPVMQGVPDEVTDPAEVLGELEAIDAQAESAQASLDSGRESLAEADAAQREIDACAEKVQIESREIESLEAQIADRRQRIEALHLKARDAGIERDRIQAKAKKAIAEAEELIAAVPDREPVKARLESLEAENSHVRANQERSRVEQHLLTARATHSDLDDRVKSLDEARRKRIEAAEFPLPELKLAESGVTYNGIPFDQASAKEQNVASMAICAAMNPTLRLVLIRDGSLLDDEAVAGVAAWAEDKGFQVLMERVGEDAHTSVVIENGEVAAR